MTNFKTYPEYKDSGVQWLGTVPKHWEMRRNKYLLNEVSKLSEYGKEELLTVSHYTGITKRRDRIVDDTDLLTTAKSLIGYKKVDKNNLVMNIMLAWNGSLGISPFYGIVSPAYCVFEINQEKLNPRYLHYLHRSPLYTGIFKTASTGVIDSRLRLYPDKYFSLTTCFPSIKEQIAIARFLDYKTAQIVRFIKAKKRMIELLKEQKQVIINDAVTGKIVIKDEGGRLKAEKRPDSSFLPHPSSFFQTVPEGWEVKRGKFFFKEVDNRSFTGQEELLSVSHITGVTPRSEKNINMFKAESYIGYKICSPGQIAVNTMWAWMAAVGVSKHTGIISSSYHTYKQKDNYFNNDFLDLLLRIRPYKILYTLNSKGITSSRLRLYPDDFLNILFLCPLIKEQESILNWFKKKTINLDLAISRTEREIALMQEFRTRLISDVVTGKIDVRDIEIPDIAGIDATIDESIDESEGEEELEIAEAEE